MSEWTAALHHGFLHGIARLSPEDARALLVPLCRDLRVAERRLGNDRPLHVHPDLRDTDTGAGPLIAWGNRVRSDPRFADLLKIVLPRLGGPWVNSLPGATYTGAIAPPVDDLEAWLGETIRCLLGWRCEKNEHRAGMVAFGSVQAGGPHQYGIPESDASVWYWKQLPEMDDALARDCPMRGTLDVLDNAARQIGSQVVVLDSARRSARKWRLDCAAHELHRAILGLTVYADALCVPNEEGVMPSREKAAEVYHHNTTIPMSQERGNLGPSARRARSFVAGPHGLKYFDMHVKPGNLTRVHIWVTSEPTAEGSAIQRIYIGYCGEHLR